MECLVFVVIDRFDENLNGYIQDHLIGIFTSLAEARFQIDELELENFRWLGKTRCKFTKNNLAHEIVIEEFIMNDLTAL